MQIKQIKAKELKKYFKGLARNAGEHAFIFFLILVFLALIFGGLTYYRYTLLIQKTPLEPGTKLIQFNEKAYQDILQEWQVREQKYKQADTKTYPDPFKGPPLSE